MTRGHLVGSLALVTLGVACGGSGFEPGGQVARIVLSTTDATLQVGQTLQLTAEAQDADGALVPGVVLTWTSTNPAAARVGETGAVEGVSVGDATIRVSADGRSADADVHVQATVAPVASVTVTPDPASVLDGRTVQFTATLRDAEGNVLAGRTVNWASSATGVATIGSTSGLATGVDPGTATITASSEGRQDAATLTVTAVPVGSVVVTPGSAMIAAGGGTVQLAATVRDANGNVLTGRTVTWSSNNTGRATVSSAGRVTGQSNLGTVTITAASGGVTGTAAVVVSRAAGTYLDQGYCDAGAPQKMDVYVPAASFPRPAPVAVFIHGGGWQDGDKSEFTNAWRFRSVKDKLTARGYIVANLNYRLATATSNPWPAQIHDVKCAVKHLRANANTWGVDPTRFGAWGTSAGSHLAAMLGLTSASAGLEPPQHTGQSSRVQAVADLAGPTDLTKPDELNFDYRQVFISSADSVNGSPVSHVSGEDAPFLILHGSNDGVVEEPQATALYNLLQLSGVASTFTRFVGLDHSFEPSSTTQRDQIAEQIADFFDANVKDAAAAPSFFAASVDAYSTTPP